MPFHGLQQSAAHACAGLPTLWIAEGLFYYLEMDACAKLLQGMAALAAPGSALIMTHLSLAFYKATQRALQVLVKAPISAEGPVAPALPSMLTGCQLPLNQNIQGAGSTTLDREWGVTSTGQQPAAPGLNLLKSLADE